MELYYNGMCQYIPFRRVFPGQMNYQTAGPVVPAVALVAGIRPAVEPVDSFVGLVVAVLAGIPVAGLVVLDLAGCGSSPIEHPEA